MQKLILTVADEIVQCLEGLSFHFVPIGHLSQKLM